MPRIANLETFDIRFPTSRELDGSDAMNPDPDYSAAYVDHLHEHFVDPCVVAAGRYRAPTAPGYSTEIRRASLERHAFPHGEVWATAPVG